MPRIYLKVPFPEKNSAKSLGARWNSEIGSWYVPEGIDTAAFGIWLNRGGSRTGELATTTLASGTTGGRGLAERAFPAGNECTATALTVKPTSVSLSRLLGGVTSAVAAAYRAGVWTTVEVSEVRIRGGHVYLELSERGAEGALLAKTTGTIWSAAAQRILPEFERATGVTLAPGIKLLVRAKPVYKPQYGLSVDIDAIDPDYTLGDFEARKREIRARLRADGVFEAQKQLVAPWDYERVLVIAPDGAAGLGDFQAESERLARHGVCQFVYAMSRFQGEGATREIAACLHGALASWSGTSPDAVALIRGGGAVNDLAWLNDYALARMICDLPVPVFTGIGHERDSTLLDEVAHTAFDTPSKVIAGIEQLVVQRSREARFAFTTIVESAQRATELAKGASQRLEAQVRADTLANLARAKHETERLLTAVKAASVDTVHDASAAARSLLAGVERGATAALAQASSGSRASLTLVLERTQSLANAGETKIQTSMSDVRRASRDALATARTRTEGLIREISGQGPAETLGRGFAVVRGPGGAPITRLAQAKLVSSAVLEFADGTVNAKLEPNIDGN